MNANGRKLIILEYRIFVFVITLLGFSLPLVRSQNCLFDDIDWPGGIFTCDTSNYQLVFSDEFDQGQLDTSKWFTYYPYTDDHSDQTAYCRTHGNREAQIYLDKNLVFTDSTLQLVARKQDTIWFDARRKYTSGMIYSKHQFKYGKFEIRFKVPKGRGFWPAFWLWGIDECDVFEFCCHKPKVFKTNMHFKCDDKSFMKNKKHKRPNYAKDFHVISVEWEPEYYLWRVDGRIVRIAHAYTTEKGKKIDCGTTVPAGTIRQNKLISEKWMHVIANLAVSPKGGYCKRKGVNKRTPFPSAFEIDYIRVYQKDRQTRRMR